MIYTESKGKKLRVVIFDSNGTNVLSVITNERVLASNKSKVIQVRYKQSTAIYQTLKDVSVNDSYQHIVFVSDRSGTTKIYQMTEDGNDEMILNGTFTTPQFLKYNNASTKITLTELSGTDIIKAIDENGNVIANPTPTSASTQWSSYALDGSDVCVYTESNGGNREIYYSIAGATPVATGIISSNIISPQITSDGNFLIYSDVSTNQIKRVDFPSLANPITLYTSLFTLYNISLSRDGVYIGFTQTDVTGYFQLFRIGIGGGSPTQLTTGLSSKYFYDFNDDSTKIVYGDSNGVAFQLKTCAIDGTNIQNISNNAYSDYSACFKPLV